MADAPVVVTFNVFQGPYCRLRSALEPGTRVAAPWMLTQVQHDGGEITI